MPKFRNISADARHVGTTDGLLLQPDQLHSVDGELADEDDEAYYVGFGDDLRAYPKSTWKLEGKVLDKPAKSATKADWVAYATAHGVEGAEDMTKDELVAKYTDDSEGGE